MLSSRLKITLIALAALFWIAGSVWSQTVDDEAMNQIEAELDMLSRDVAEEYLDILENLSDLFQDYADYVGALPDDAAGHEVKMIGIIQDNLRRDSYIDNPEKLLRDLNEAIEALKAIENEHRVKHNTNSPKCCRLGRNLRKELVINSELIEDYLDKQTVQVLGQEETKKYVAEALKALKEVEKVRLQQDVQEEAIQKYVDALRKLGLQGRIIVTNPPDAPGIIDLSNLPDVPEVPEAPEAPEIDDPRNRTRPDVIVIPGTGRKASGRKGAGHMSQGSVSASNPAWPIYIENPSGEVIVTGSNAKMINATLTLEVASTSHAKEKEFMDQAVLAVAQTDGEYSVRVSLPRLSDHRTELLGCRLEVSVPRTNPVRCESAFGTVQVADIDGGVTVDCENSSVELVNIKRGARVENAMGAVSAENVSGTIDIITSYAPISLTRCNGPATLENQYSSIMMDRCEGKVRISNSGVVRVEWHTGDVEIENAYGQVEVDRLTGSLVAVNGYQPLIVSRISGSAELENSYGEISVEEVGAHLSAATNAGQIFVESTPGPVELINSQGDINVSLDRNFRGGSSITNTGGTIKLAILQKPNLVASLHTIDGDIRSSLPLSVRTRGNTKTAELVLGDGGETLDVSGSGSAIIVQGR